MNDAIPIFTPRTPSPGTPKLSAEPSPSALTHQLLADILVELRGLRADIKGLALADMPRRKVE